MRFHNTFSINLMPFRIYIRVIALSASARNFQGSLGFSALATIILEILLFTRLTNYQAVVFQTLTIFAIFKLTSHTSVAHIFG